VPEAGASRSRSAVWRCVQPCARLRLLDDLCTHGLFQVRTGGWGCQPRRGGLAGWPLLSWQRSCKRFTCPSSVSGLRALAWSGGCFGVRRRVFSGSGWPTLGKAKAISVRAWARAARPVRPVVARGAVPVPRRVNASSHAALAGVVPTRHGRPPTCTCNWWKRASLSPSRALHPARGSYRPEFPARP
jgi:hypothetical protein